MSGGGNIIEKLAMTLEDGRQVVRYHVISQYRPGWFDETYVYAEPSEDEPQLGEALWWGGEQTIYFGANDSKRLTKVGYSFSPDARAALKGGEAND
ncbi:hypothetical protein [Gellertiella hungarica]|uniref:Uncharacterized protein n=1 Tax=Gellertiella hungarica TaxID=1572859 RepID=A0A7W6J4D0_9HYPH|nr:hypothetical protein [Gellertiella hungarica]MBB4063633.1 hypothetical protein [Gellertiella hungarica]